MTYDPSHPAASPEPSEDRSRRRFLQWLAGIGALISGWLVGRPVIGAFLAPLTPTVRSDKWIKVADDVSLLDIGTPLRTDFVQLIDDAWVQRRLVNSVWLYTEDGEHFIAWNGHCPHLGCSVTFDAERDEFFCPCHHGEFDKKTGAVLRGPPPRGLDELTVEVRDEAVWVRYKDYRLGVPAREEV